MTISKTMIFNMAINELGVSAPITNALATDDTRAIILRNYYEAARDETLKAFDWNFAEKFRILTPIDNEVLDPRFRFIYDYPQDCLAARDIFEKDGDKLKKKFKLSCGENNQKVILTNASPAILRYTRRVEIETLFDMEFAISLSLYLAGLTGKAITGSEQKANAALNKYWDKVRLAQISNASEGQDVDEDDKTFLDYR